jgi:lipid-binding SYLF domain-containing protein
LGPLTAWSTAVTVVQDATQKKEGRKMKTIRMIGLTATLALAGAIAAAAANGERLDSDVRAAIQRFEESSPRMQRLFNESYGYAIFPSVDKGAVGIGGAEGRGEVYEGGVLVGRSKLTQVTVGAQLGAESYAEVIFFKTPEALQEFKEGKTAMSAALSAVLADDGAAAEAKYQHGVLVCAMAKSGVMFEASVGGQHFKFSGIPASSQLPAPTETAPPPLTSLPPAAPPELPSQPQSPTPPQ